MTRVRTARYLGALIFAAVAGLMVLQAPAHAEDPGAACKSQTFPLYPGSAIGRMRYAEIDVHFEGCDFDNLTASITTQQVNTVGFAVGFELDGANVVLDQAWDAVPMVPRKTFTAKIDAKHCPAQISWLCLSTFSFTAQYDVRFHASNDVQITQSEVYASEIGMALFQTP